MSEIGGRVFQMCIRARITIIVLAPSYAVCPLNGQAWDNRAAVAARSSATSRSISRRCWCRNTPGPRARGIAGVPFFQRFYYSSYPYKTRDSDQTGKLSERRAPIRPESFRVPEDSSAPIPAGTAEGRLDEFRLNNDYRPSFCQKMGAGIPSICRLF